MHKPFTKRVRCKKGEEEGINSCMRIAELLPNHPDAIKARHDKWRRDLIARLVGHAAKREREDAKVTEALPSTVKTPDQQRLASLQANAKRAQQSAKMERARQKQQKAQAAMAKAKQLPIPKT
jgi:hypothetical protein